MKYIVDSAINICVLFISLKTPQSKYMTLSDTKWTSIDIPQRCCLNSCQSEHCHCLLMWLVNFAKTYQLRKVFLDRFIHIHLCFVMLVEPCICLLPLRTIYGLCVSFCLCCSIVNVPNGVSVELIFFISCKAKSKQTENCIRILFDCFCRCRDWQSARTTYRIGACTLLDLLRLVRSFSNASRFCSCRDLCRGTCVTDNGTLPFRWANDHCRRCTPVWRLAYSSPSPWTRTTGRCENGRVGWIYHRLWKFTKPLNSALFFRIKLVRSLITYPCVLSSIE